MSAEINVIIYQGPTRKFSSRNQKCISALLIITGICVGFNISMFTSENHAATKISNRNGKQFTAFSALPTRPTFEADENSLLPKNFAENVSQNSATKRLILRPSRIESFVKNRRTKIFMMFLVKSACHLRERRNQVRNTWGTVEKVNQQEFAVIFLVGIADEECQRHLVKESNEFGDILQADIPDDYHNLPDKVLAGYRWVAQETQDVSDFYVFVDDDCVVNVVAVHDYFYTNHVTLTKNSSFLCGLAYNDHAKPIRPNQTDITSEKYVVSYETYSKPNYPTFCHGGMTALTFSLLDKIFLMSEKTNRSDFHLEDVYISGILRSKLNQGYKNIQPVGFDGTKRKSLVAAGSFIWHVGDLRNTKHAFAAVWGSMLKLVEVKVGNETIKGPLNALTHVTVQLNKRGLPFTKQSTRLLRKLG